MIHVPADAFDAYSQREKQYMGYSPGAWGWADENVFEWHLIFLEAKADGDSNRAITASRKIEEQRQRFENMTPEIQERADIYILCEREMCAVILEPEFEKLRSSVTRNTVDWGRPVHAYKSLKDFEILPGIFLAPTSDCWEEILRNLTFPARQSLIDEKRKKMTRLEMQEYVWIQFFACYKRLPEMDYSVDELDSYRANIEMGGVSHYRNRVNHFEADKAYGKQRRNNSASLRELMTPEEWEAFNREPAPVQQISTPSLVVETAAPTTSIQQEVKPPEPVRSSLPDVTLDDVKPEQYEQPLRYTPEAKAAMKRWQLEEGYTDVQLEDKYMGYLANVVEKMVDKINADYEILEPFAVKT